MNIRDLVSLSATPSKQVGVVVQEIDENLVILDPRTKTYNILNGTAKVVFNGCTGSESVLALVDKLALMFPAQSRSQIEEDVLGCVASLADLELICVS